jgi:sugar-specific transcriptional regulator TrmB
MSLGVSALQTLEVRQQFIKYLPQIAQEHQESIRQTVKDCFAKYEREIIKRINDDIKSRKAELENLLQQKESREIDRANEIKRLRD